MLGPTPAGVSRKPNVVPGCRNFVVRTRNNLGYWMKPLDRLLGRVFNRLVDQTIANCGSCRQAVIDDEGAEPQSVVVLENGVDLMRNYRSIAEGPVPVFDAVPTVNPGACSAVAAISMEWVARLGRLPVVAGSVEAKRGRSCVKTTIRNSDEATNSPRYTSRRSPSVSNTAPPTSEPTTEASE